MKDQDTTNLTNKKLPSENGLEKEKVQFLGKSMSTGEYEESCRNLEEFFKILIKWQKKEGANEKETQS